MKTIHTKKTMIWTQLIVCGLLILSSCAKTKKQIPPDQVTQLSFVVNGIAEASDAGAATANRSAVPVANTERESQLLDLGGLAAMVSVTSGPIKAQEVSPNNSKQRAADMTNGYKYRVVVLDATTGAVVGSVQATANTASGAVQDDAVKIDVVKGATYKWYAYSYNESTSVTALPNEANPVFTPSYDKDLLIAQGTATAGTGAGQKDTQVPILFKHALAKVTVRFDASSRTDGISVLNAALAQSDYFNKGTVALNTTSGTLSYTITGQHNVSAINVGSLSPAPTVASASFYTIPVTPTETAIPSFKVNVASLTVGPLSASGKTIDFGSTILPKAGKEEIAIINILDVTPVGPVFWATGNLYYTKSTNTYRIRDEDIIARSLMLTEILQPSFAKTDGWNWMASKTYGGLGEPNNFDRYNLVDPCKSVLPLNTWRMPTRQEFEALLPLSKNPQTYEQKATMSTTSIGYSRFRNTPSSKWLQFNFDGDQIRPSYNGFFWTSTGDKSPGSTYYNKAYILQVIHGDNPIVTSNFNNSSYYNIRCVLAR
ncbi:MULTISPECIES: hypothetical protein [unclassified Sphingobacterium]|uniref:hypothetical protein n=1 Tax=unclassified Sphingobacterium TaxID=2609468 RepID=UPI0025F95592|nr:MULTISPECIES: hypothetical protein [unclassified Sphingobacterium]